MIKGLIAALLSRATLRRAADERKQEIIMQDNDPAEIDAIAGRGGSVRVIAFMVFVLPFIVSVLIPSWGSQIWQGVEQMPGWYVELFIAINGAVWGLTELKPILPQLVRSVKDAIRGR